MARMTPQEATAVNILLGYFAGRPELPPGEIVRSLEILANRAHNRLQGGWDEFAVRCQWHTPTKKRSETRKAQTSLPKAE